MAVLSADGSDLTAGHLPSEGLKDAVVQTPEGEILHLRVTGLSYERSPLKFSLWGIGGIFALLGAAVILRRPDLRAARLFAFFAVFTASAIAVLPSAGEPFDRWAIVIENLTLTGVGATCLPFVLYLTDSGPMRRRSLLTAVMASVAVLLSGAFVMSVVAYPRMYEVVRPAFLLFLAFSVLSAVGLLAYRSIRFGPSGARQQARIALYGMVLGALPVVILNLVPEAMDVGSLVPQHLALLSLAIIPISFAYAIMQHQMLGIRRLVHRGMIYSIVTFVLLTVGTLALSLGLDPSGGPGTGGRSSVVIAAFLVGGIVVFPLMRSGARWLVDRFVYKDTLDYEEFFASVRENLLTANPNQDISQEISKRLEKALGLESALVFLGPQYSEAKLVSAAGRRADFVAREASSRLSSRIAESSSRNLSELRLGSDSLLLVPLGVSEKYLGYMLLGPKAGGEVFVDQEQRLVATIAPLLALAIDKAKLSEELRDLNHRLVKVQESERARIAADLHDGPLQKVILLTGAAENVGMNPGDLARQTVGEIREICSRLRPAIIDDLGLVPALEWLLDGVSTRSGIQTQLVTSGIEEDARFSADTELALFRVAQEATNNVVKHAKATRLDMALSREEADLLLTVTDNGTGFSVRSVGKGGFGLAGMRERVSQLNGSLEITSANGQGSTVAIRVAAAAAQQVGEH